MSIDEQLKIIDEQYKIMAYKLHQAEKLKDAVMVDELGNIVRSSRKKQELTRQALCELSGVSYTTLNKIETGSVSLRLDIVINVLKTLGLKMWIA